MTDLILQYRPVFARAFALTISVTILLDFVNRALTPQARPIGQTSTDASSRIASISASKFAIAAVISSSAFIVLSAFNVLPTITGRYLVFRAKSKPVTPAPHGGIEPP